MRGNLKFARIRLLGLLLLFLITASGVFAFQAEKSHQGNPPITLKTALKAIDFASETDISIDSEFSANLRQSINFNRNRYYSPALGRFTSKDPIGFNGGMNLYRYADNNPIRFIDPWGLEPEFAVIQDTIDPNKFFIFHIPSGQIYDNSGRGYTLSDAEDIWQCNGVFVKFPGGKSPSETLDYIYTEATKLLIVHQSSALFDEWVANRYGVNPTNHVINASISEADARHIFRNDHNIADTASNRQLLVDTASHFNNYLGSDIHGNAWFAKNLPNGSQAWTSVRGGIIRNGGINSTPRSFNPTTGFSALPR